MAKRILYTLVGCDIPVRNNCHLHRYNTLSYLKCICYQCTNENNRCNFDSISKSWKNKRDNSGNEKKKPVLYFFNQNFIVLSIIWNISLARDGFASKIVHSSEVNINEARILHAIMNDAKVATDAISSSTQHTS